MTEVVINRGDDDGEGGSEGGTGIVEDEGGGW